MAPDDKAVSRRDAVARLGLLGGLAAGAVGAGVWLRSRSRKPAEAAPPVVNRDLRVPPDPAYPDVVVVSGGEPEELVRAAVEALGGMSRFVSAGDVVVLKPNVAWDRTPEQAANTNPQVVAETARLCFEAGAAEVIVTDVTCNEARRCFRRSGIGAAAEAVGARVVLPEDRYFRRADLQGSVLGRWPVLEPLLTADRVINIPVAKHHSLTRVTLGMKNWYGILGGQRRRLHQRIHESIADLAAFLQPTLTLIDAYRVLLRGGPTGGNLEYVAVEKALFAGTDPVALDARVAKTYWDLDAASLPFLEIAERRRLGRADFEAVPTRVIGV